MAKPCSHLSSVYIWSSFLEVNRAALAFHHRADNMALEEVPQSVGSRQAFWSVLNLCLVVKHAGGQTECRCYCCDKVARIKVRPFLLMVRFSPVTGPDVCVGGAGVILEDCCPQRGAFERPLIGTSTV